MRSFVNWAGTVISSPKWWHTPDSEEALSDIVRRTAQRGGRVKVIGAGHSWSPIAAPHDVALSLDKLSGILSHDPVRSEVTVRAGTRLKDLNAALAQRGLALPIVGSIAEQAIAGAIATGTHGSSLTHGNLASLVTAARLIDGQGNAVSFLPDDPGLQGVRVHLGALGILTELTLRVIPAFRLAEEITEISVARAISELEVISHSAEYVKIWWIPHTEHALVYRYFRTDEPDSTRPHPATLRWIDDQLGQKRIFPLFAAFQNRFPSTVPALNSAIRKTLLRPRLVGTSTLMLSTVMPIVHRETEAAVSLSQGAEAFDRTVRMHREEPWRANFPLEVRFVRGDDAWLSPAHGRDTCQIGAYTSQFRHTDAYFAGFWRALRSLSPRPHWGKEHAYTHHDIRPLYPAFDQFLALRDKLDPNRTFSSPHLARILGTAGVANTAK